MVARIAFPRPGKTPRFAVDALVRRRLSVVDGRVARPIANSDDRSDLNALVDGRAWAVDSFIDGDDGTSETVGPAIWAELGGLLSKLHQLPIEGVEGTAATRFQQAWPLDPSPLSDHPISRVTPPLLEGLSRLEDDIRMAASRSAVVLHGDPASYNLRISRGGLVGLVDFNDTFVGPPAWDFAWMAAYSGWRAVKAALPGHGATGDVSMADIALLSIPTALHSASRAALLDQPDRMARMVAFLEKTLEMSFWR